MAVKIEGTCDPKFNRVKDAFAENFEKRAEVGAAASVVLDGKSVVDIWAGHADKAKTRPWTRDTLVNVYSTTKGVTAICAHRLVDKGLLDIDAPVAKYWPEFAKAGKDKLPVRYLLSHRAGLPAVSKILDDNALFNWDTMTAALAEQEPWWEPGTAHGYHAVTFGWLVGEVIRRITGKTPGSISARRARGSARPGFSHRPRGEERCANRGHACRAATGTGRAEHFCRGDEESRIGGRQGFHESAANG